MKLAAIDIGSNSVHMIIASVSAARSFEVIDRVKEMVFLGRSVAAHGHLTPEAFEAGLAAVCKFYKLAQRHGVHEICAVATAAVREADNGGEFLYAISEQTGIVPQVISGSEEAGYIYLAVRNAIDLSKRSALIFDIGGGSVETLLGDARELAVGTSAKLGVQRLRAQFGAGPLSKRDRKQLEVQVREVVGPALRSARERGFELVVGTSGTILALGEACTRLRSRAAQGHVTGRILELSELRLVTDQLVALSPSDRVAAFGVDVSRADSLHVGGVLLCTLLELAGASRLTLCEAALREGVVLDYLRREGEHIRELDRVRDIRRHSVLELAERCGQTGPHPARVARLSLDLFDQTLRLHGLTSSDRRLLEYAALLHDIGQHIGYERHEHHAAYIVRNGDLRGFHDEERELIALIARYHRKSRPRRRDLEYARLPAAQRKAVRVLSGILRICDGLDRSHHQLVSSLSCKVTTGALDVVVTTCGDAELELWGARRKARPLEKALGVTITLRAEPEERVDLKTA